MKTKNNGQWLKNNYIPVGSRHAIKIIYLVKYNINVIKSNFKFEYANTVATCIYRNN